MNDWLGFLTWSACVPPVVAAVIEASIVLILTLCFLLALEDFTMPLVFLLLLRREDILILFIDEIIKY